MFPKLEKMHLNVLHFDIWETGRATFGFIAFIVYVLYTVWAISKLVMKISVLSEERCVWLVVLQ